jgi:hypothetical protein
MAGISNLGEAKRWPIVGAQFRRQASCSSVIGRSSANRFHDSGPRAIIGRSIVHHDEFIGLQSLGEDAADRLLDEAGAVVERDDGDVRKIGAHQRPLEDFPTAHVAAAMCADGTSTQCRW